MPSEPQSLTTETTSSLRKKQYLLEGYSEAHRINQRPKTGRKVPPRHLLSCHCNVCMAVP